MKSRRWKSRPIKRPAIDVALELKEIVEALLFASDEQVTLETLVLSSMI